MIENHNFWHLQDNRPGKKVNRLANSPYPNQEINLGRELRILCAQRGLSMRALRQSHSTSFFTGQSLKSMNDKKD